MPTQLIRRQLLIKSSLALLGASIAVHYAPYNSLVARTMAWFSHGDGSNESLIQKLKNNRIVHNPAVERAMTAVDRAHFVDDPDYAYIDSPSPIGYQATISAPHMHAYALELLASHLLRPNSHALDVGSGSGYLTACFAVMMQQAGNNGKAVGIEHIPELTDKSRVNVAKDTALQQLVDKGQMKLIVGDGYAGHPELAPYHAIHVGAAAPKIPQALIEQLAPGGRMVIPVGPEGGMQYLSVIDKNEDGRVTKKDEMAVMYVPLTSKEHQLSGRRVW